MSAWLMLLLLAADLPERPQAISTAIVDVSPDRIVERNGVRWSEWIAHEGEPKVCGTPGVPCVADTVSVRNDASITLRCQGAIHYSQPNANGIQDVELTRIVRARRLVTVVHSQSPAEMKIASYAMDCTPLPALPPLNNPPECKMNLLQPVDPQAYYPQASKDAWHAGPVVLEFTVSATAATPGNIAVVQTSTYTDLDAAAVRMIGTVMMTTNCEGRRFRTLVDFTR